MAAEFGWWAPENRMLFLSLFCEFKIVRKVEVLKSGTEVSCLGILKYNNDPRGWNGTVWWLICNPEDSLWVWSQPGSHSERNWSQDSKNVWVWKITNSITMKLPLFLPGSSAVPWTCLALLHLLSCVCSCVCMYVWRCACVEARGQFWVSFSMTLYLSFWDAVSRWA